MDITEFDDLENESEPLTREEREKVVKWCINYDDIRYRIENGILNSKVERLDQIVQAMVEVQFMSGDIVLAEECLPNTIWPVEDAALSVLQIHQPTIEFVLEELRRRENRAKREKRARYEINTVSLLSVLNYYFQRPYYVSRYYHSKSRNRTRFSWDRH